ncbi:MAG TPA: tetraacyldisaccharide 4'-kinase [Bacteroidia bacterium]|nr:tetraacyldisaccharide 4'-kinase [Bacteroidia bacterium]HNT80659.1 tetraacyldisaccharide 4'-kinase [Bacteroidia bacterium]
MRLLLLPFSWIYGWVVAYRNYLYDKGIKSSYRFGIAVINVGNLSTGGTGKTPHIEYLIRLLKDKYKIAVLSRGYGRKSKGFLLVRKHTSVIQSGDEPAQIKNKFPDIHVAVCEKRVKGCFNLIATYPELEVILLDDAYQHRSVKAGMNILLTSYGRMYSQDRLLPAGNLREPQSSSERADIIVVTKVPANLSEKNQQEIANQIDPQKSQALFLSELRYGKFVDIKDANKTMDMEAFSSLKSAILLTGIARSNKIVQDLTKLNSNIFHIKYNDHHNYSVTDVKKIVRNAQQHSSIVVTTEKDAIKLLQPELKLHLDPVQVYYLPIEVDFHKKDKTHFDNKILTYVEKSKRNRKSPPSQN